MGKIIFEEVFETLKHGVTSLAQVTIKDYVSEAESAGHELLQQMKANLEKWTVEFTEAKITQLELTDFIEGQKEVLEMAALTQMGIAEADLDNFKSGIFSLVENTILGLI